MDITNITYPHVQAAVLSMHFVYKQHACHIKYTDEDSGYNNAVLNHNNETNLIHFHKHFIVS
jgi:hypothetical protein